MQPLDALPRQRAPRIALPCPSFHALGMALPHNPFLLCCLCVGLLIFFVASASSSVLSSAYDVLQTHGFPEGLLPNSVIGYTLDSNGRFTLNLYSPCAIANPNAYPVNYSSNIAGRISYQLLYDLIGVEVKVGSMWWEIDVISANDTDLLFKAGPFEALYPVSNFIDNPDCRARISNLFSRW